MPVAGKMLCHKLKINVYNLIIFSSKITAFTAFDCYKCKQS